MKSTIILFVIFASLAACGVLYYKGIVDSPSAMMKNFNNPSNRIPAANLPEEIGADRFSKKPSTTIQQQYPPSTSSSSTVPSSSSTTNQQQQQHQNSNNINQRYIIDEKDPLSSKFLLSKRYDQTLSDYEQKNRKNLKKYLSDLEKPNLVKKINGLPIEPVDIWIGKGGKRLKMIKLLGREITNKGDYARDFLYSSNNNNNQRRLVWFDLGARVWPKGSTQWFSRHYPNSTQFEVECYDVLDLEHTYPPKGRRPFKEFRFHSKAAWTKEGEVQIGGVKMASVARDDQVLDPKKVTVWKTKSIDFGQLLLNNYSEDAGFVRKSSFTDTDADAEQSTSDVEEENKKKKKQKEKEKGKTSASAAIDGDITTYISEKKKNFIIVKMDIEGGEWPLIKHLEDTGALSRIDEMMLECHPPPADSEYVTSDKVWKPSKHGQMHPDCVRLINRMRLSGVYAHGWF